MTAFLMAGGTISSLILRVTGKEASYAPAAFFAAKMLVGCEFQYTAKRVKNSAVLALKLLASPKLRNCLLFSSFDSPETYRTALRSNANAPTLTGCKVDLQGVPDEPFLNQREGPDAWA